MPKLKIINKYGITPNFVLNSKILSFKAKGLFGYLQSKPENWDFSADRISRDAKESRDAILSGLRELESFGVLERHKFKNEKGQRDIEYILLEEPRAENPTWTEKDKKTRAENPTPENPTSDNPTTNKEILIKKELEINNNNIDPKTSDLSIKGSGQKEKEKSCGKKEKEKDIACLKFLEGKEKYKFVIDFLNYENTQIMYQINQVGHDVYLGKQMIELEKLIKDGFELETIKTILNFIKQDHFRAKNILSIRKLREKDKNGIPYIIRMIDEIKNRSPPKQVNTIGSL